MAAPLSADRLVAALKAEGVKVAERNGWRAHNRNHKGSWSNLNGIVIHHTAGADSLSLCWEGTADLPGPLCHTHLAKNGTATMVGYGRANHAGTFAANAFDAMHNESEEHPRPDMSEPIDANACTYGIEIENLGNGRDPYPVIQYDAAVRWAAALCRAHGWTANSVIGHKEGTRRKIDPSFDMDAFRADVDERLAHPASWNPDDPQEDDVPLTKADVKTLFATDGVIGVPADWSPGNNEWTAASLLVDSGKRLRALQAASAAQNATVAELAKTVAQLAANSADLDADALVARIKGEIEKVTIRLDVPDA